MPGTPRAWLQAARPLAQANIAVPLLFGQSLAFSQAGAFSWRRFVLVHVYGVFVHLFIVLSNDAADWRGDLKNTTYNVFSGGSRVVPQGKLTPRQLANAGLLMALGIGSVGAYVGFIERLPFALALAALPVAILWAYSFPPFRLSYRGGGEILQALGVGVVLPLTAFYYQAGSFTALIVASVLPTALLGWAGNVVTALPDYPADQASDKRTLAVLVGQRHARVVAVAITATAIAVGWMVLPSAPAWSLFPLALLLPALRLVPRADAKRRRDCLAFVMLVGGAGSIAIVAWTVAAFIGAH